MTPVQEGEVLAGKYRVERVLGVGGMGVVVAAMHLQLDERVALKFLLPEALGNAEAVARFAREARAAVKIKSMHVARVSDVGTLETGAPFMVMEFLHGQDLSALIRDRGPLPYQDAVDFLLQACEALAEAHALGIVHRDLKPANLFMITGADGAPCIKVLDFGISKITTADSSGDYGMTRTQAIMGSPLYMSPEQMTSSRDVDGRADIWAIGTILYELLTGRPPFLGDTMPQLCGMILQEAPPHPQKLRPDLPEGLALVMLRCLEKKRDARFANVGELAGALAPFGTRNAARSAERVSKVLSAAGISSSNLELQPPASVTAGTNPAWGTTQSRSSHGALWLSLGALVVAAAGGVALFLHYRSAPGTAAPQPAAVALPSSEPARVTASAPPAPTVSPSAELKATEPTAPLVAPAISASTAPSLTASAAPSPAPAKTAGRSRPVAAKGTAPKAPAAQPAASPAAKPSPPAKAAIDPLEGRH